MTVNWSALGDPVMLLRIALQVLLFAASAIFSMSETALFSLRDSDLRRIDRTDPAKAGRLRDLLEEPRQLIVSILTGNELINIAATINLAGILLVLLGSPEAAALANALIMIPLLLILGEITPKTLAVTAPVPVSTRVVEPVISPWVRFVAPLRAAVRLVADRITTLIVGKEGRSDSILSSDEFALYLRDIEHEGLVTRAERRLILNLIDAGDTPVTEIMVPRPQVAFIDADRPVPEILAAFARLRHRRVPLYRGQRDNVIGVLRDERVLAAVAETPADALTLDDLTGPAMMVPATQTVADLGELFKDGDHHAAIVVNEYGGVAGLVSADDVFGYLTRGRGVFLDGFDTIEEVGGGAFACVGLTPLKALRRAGNLPLARREGVSTVGGHIMALLGRLPEAGDEVRDAGLVLRVVSMERILVDRVLVAPEGHPALGGEDRP